MPLWKQNLNVNFLVWIFFPKRKLQRHACVTFNERWRYINNWSQRAQIRFSNFQIRGRHRILMGTKRILCQFTIKIWVKVYTGKLMTNIVIFFTSSECILRKMGCFKDESKIFVSSSKKKVNNGKCLFFFNWQLFCPIYNTFWCLYVWNLNPCLH